MKEYITAQETAKKWGNYCKAGLVFMCGRKNTGCGIAYICLGYSGECRKA